MTAMSQDELKSPDPNPYEFGEIPEPDPFQDPVRPRPPGPVAVFFSVVLGLVVAAATFCVTFFFTCLGISNSSLNDEAEITIVFGVSGLTAVGALVLSVWGLLKLGKLFRS